MKDNEGQHYVAKVLIFSDIHLHNWAYGSTYINGWNSRLLDQKKVCDQIVDLTRLHRVDYVVCGGDVFHTHGRVEAGPLQVAGELFHSLLDEVKKRSGKVYCLKGNHDLGRETSSVDWLKDLGVHVIDDVGVDTDIKAGFISYCDDEETFDRRRDILNAASLEYWFCHQGVKYTPVGSDFVIPNEFLSSDKLPSTQDFKMCYTGHYHSPHWAADKLIIIGSPMQLNWSDSGETRGCIILDTFNDGNERYDLNAPKFVALDGALQPIPVHILQDKRSEEIAVAGNFIKVLDEIPPIFMEEVRQKLKDAGARSVEFAFKQPTSRIGMAPTTFDIKDLISRYEKLNKVDDNGHEIGQRLRSGEYSCV